MKAFVILVLLAIIFFLFASSSLAQVDLTPDTPPAQASNPVVVQGEPQVITIQNPSTVYSAPTNTSPVVPVTGSRICTDPYVVQPGDMLSSISDLCDVSIVDIRMANPSITNANLIYPGQQIRIPGITAAVPVPVTGAESPAAQPAAPTSIPPAPQAQALQTGAYPQIRAGAPLQVQAYRFPPSSLLQVTVGPVSGPQNLITTGVSDASGNLIANIVAPAAPDNQTPWVVVVISSTDPTAQARSEPFVIQP